MGRKRNDYLSKPYFMDYWTDRLTNIACNLFKWENLPEEINRMAMEKTIMLGGFAIFFKDRELDTYFALGGALSGVDAYGYPTTVLPVSMSGDIRFNQMSLKKDGVIIYANRTRGCAMPYILEYADKLSELDLAIKLNVMAMKHPVVMKGTKETEQSFNTLMHQYEETYYQILVDKGVNLDDSVETLQLGVNSMEILNLQKEKETVLNEFYNLFGVTGSVEKRERIISGEMNAMMEQIAINKAVWLSAREEAVEHINRMYGLDIKVTMNMVEQPQVTEVRGSAEGTDEGGFKDE